MLTEQDLKDADEYASDYVGSMSQWPSKAERESARLEQYESFLLVRLMEKYDE